ncbi:biotin/lipoyl-containing protein [Azospirillum halopraeferens]|uniref:biotin/lipoyl-containing protein n=1 Tax=Azospirillum halopraeferens TaxID=34010 RepID=UPI0004208A7F|nr:acetyl-CoA carboxylase biotin carboxyl carrier protein subunit [Azospirillum halopraeferens]
MRRFRITVEGTPYEVTVEELDAPARSDVAAAVSAPVAPPPAPARAPAPAPAAAGAAPAGPGAVVSPLAGTIIAVAAKAGDRVEAGQSLLTLEAMKMQTSVVAPRAGTVAAVAVAAGATVQEGQVLLTIN